MSTITLDRTEDMSGHVARGLSGSFGNRRMVDGRECMTTKKGDVGCVIYGPYETLDPGRYAIEFDVGLAEAPDVLGDPVALTLEVVGLEGTSYLVEQRLLVSHLVPGLATLRVEAVVHERRALEYRVSSSGQTGLNVALNVSVTPLRDVQAEAPARGTCEWEWQNEREYLDGYLRNVSGVLHVGANVGQERRYYWLIGVDVIWVEPIKEMYDRLVDNLAGYTRQRPIQALLADRDGKEFEFQIANNNAASSSIFDLEDSAKIWPDIQYVEKRKMVATTLATLIKREEISLNHYAALTLDCEGAELLILQGGGEALERFRYVKCEVSDFPARTGTPTVADLDALLTGLGFRELIRRAFSMGPGDEGTYWDIVWKKVVPGEPFQAEGYSLPLVAHPSDVAGLEKCE